MSVPLLATAGPAANRPELVLPVMLNVSAWLSSGSPSSMPVAQPATVCAPAFSFTDSSAPLVNTGASLTAVTVTSKDCGALVSLPPPAVPPSSDRVRVMVAVPLALAAGV